MTTMRHPAPVETKTLPDGGAILPWLSERQYECLKFIYQYSIQRRDYPLGSEIAARMGITKQAVTPLLNTLIKKEYLVRDRSVLQRNIRLTAAAIERMQRDDAKGTTPDLFPYESI